MTQPPDQPTDGPSASRPEAAAPAGASGEGRGRTCRCGHAETLHNGLGECQGCAEAVPCSWFTPTDTSDDASCRPPEA